MLVRETASCWTRGQNGGIFSVPLMRLAAKARLKLRAWAFQKDTKEWILGILPAVGSIAAMATHGEGYRENAEPSLHCAVASDYCNVHLDNIGIRSGNYNINAPQHVVDELFWQDKILPGMLRNTNAHQRAKTTQELRYSVCGPEGDVLREYVVSARPAEGTVYLT